MARVVVLVHAPVLGPGSWAGVAGELSRTGNRVVVPSLAGFADGGPAFTQRLVSRVAGQVRCGDRDDVVLVVHSGAGVLVPHLLLALGGGEATAVFADAALPGQADPGTVVEAEFLPYLRELAADGIVPPWPRWWPGEDLSPLFPDEAARQAVTSEAQPLPFAFFEELVPALGRLATVPGRLPGLPRALPPPGGRGGAGRVAGARGAGRASAHAGGSRRGSGRDHGSGRTGPVGGLVPQLAALSRVRG
jgi:hypothetical protein